MAFNFYKMKAFGVFETTKFYLQRTSIQPISGQDILHSTLK
ncbi:hypothetical protein AQEC111735_07440 [Aquirufa ecclesiirivi]